MRKKIIALLLFSTTFLTACVLEKEENNINVINKNNTEMSQNTKGEKDKNDGNNTPENKKEDSSNEIKQNTDTSLNGMDLKVKEYILNGQGDKPEATKLKWSKRFLEQVDFEKMYKNYLADGGAAGDVEWFANYITLYAPIPKNWEEMFKKDVLETYNEEIVSIKHLEDDLYQGNVLINGVETAYVAVYARTGYYHGTSEESTE